jgi:hypothetical protein
MASASVTQLNAIWKSKISFPVKIKLYKSLLLSILLYGCETWTLTADTEHRIQAFENKCYRKNLKITYLEHKTNTYVRDKVFTYAGNQKHVITVVKRRRFAWLGHVNRHKNCQRQFCREQFKWFEGREVNKIIGLTTSSNEQNAAFLN